MKVCKQTDPEKGLTPVNRNVKRLADGQMTPIHPTPTGSNHIICRKVRPPLVVDWEGTSTRTLYHVRLLEVRLPLGSMARRLF